MIRTFLGIPLCLTAALAVLCACTNTNSPPASSGPPVTIALTGTAGAPITGYYVRDGQRVQFDDVLPKTFTMPGISQIAIRKIHKEDTLLANGRSGDGSVQTSSPGGSDDGIWLTVQGGFTCGPIPPGQSLAPPENALMVISPYWYQGTWVFDDPRAGLVREPFVQGVPEMIDYLVKDIPSAKEGFRLTFSAKPFPGYQKKLTWVRADMGGNYYRMDDPPMQGWLCPAMFRYFASAPRELYARADPKSN
jgi:hypothetical protein